jgi:hypothetical protein
LVKDKPTAEFFSRTRSALGNRFYGPNASVPDISADDLITRIEELEQSLQISSLEEQREIFHETIGQFKNNNYRDRRRQMITASICGKISSLKDYTPNRGMLDALLGPHSNVKTVRWGQQHEADAIRLYQKTKNCKVLQSGMFVSLEHGFLGASPDGVIGEDGLVEVKCPWSAKDFAEERDVVNNCKYLEYSKGGEIHLKKSDIYYKQVVMQLHVSQRQYCDFVVWTQGPPMPGDDKIPLNREGHIIVIRILRDEQTLSKWQEILPKLIRFYREDLAPELIDPRFKRNMGYRQPEYRLSALRQREQNPPKKRTSRPPKRRKKSQDSSIDPAPASTSQKSRSEETEDEHDIPRPSTSAGWMSGA